MVSAISSGHLCTPLVARLWSIHPSSETQVLPLGSLSGRLGHWTCKPTPGEKPSIRGILSDYMLLCWGGDSGHRMSQISLLASLSLALWSTRVEELFT